MSPLDRSPLSRPLTQRLKSALAPIELDQAFSSESNKGADADSRYDELPHDSNENTYETNEAKDYTTEETQLDLSAGSPIKTEPEAIPTPPSPASKGIDFSDLPGFPNEDITTLNIPYSSNYPVEQDDTMSCTPTQTLSHSDQLQMREMDNRSPFSAVDVSPLTATATAPHTPLSHRSPLIQPSPSPATATMTPSTSTSTSPSDSVLRSPIPPLSLDEDERKPNVKSSESDAEEDMSAGARRRARREKRQADARGNVDASSVSERGFHGYQARGYLSPSPYASPPNYMPPAFPMPSIPTMGMSPPAEDPIRRLEREAQELGYTLSRDPQANVGASMSMGGARHQQMQAIDILRAHMAQKQAEIEHLRQQQQAMMAAAVDLSQAGNWSNGDSSLGSDAVMGTMHSLDDWNRGAMVQDTQGYDLASVYGGYSTPDDGFSPAPSSGSSFTLSSNSSFMSAPPPSASSLSAHPPMAQVYAAQAPGMAALGIHQPVSLPLSHPSSLPHTSSLSHLPLSSHISPPSSTLPHLSPTSSNFSHISTAPSFSGSTNPTFRAVASDNDISKESAYSGSGTHKCESCGKKFRRPSGLKDHMNIHSGEKRAFSILLSFSMI